MNKNERLISRHFHGSMERSVYVRGQVALSHILGWNMQNTDREIFHLHVQQDEGVGLRLDFV